MGAWGITMRESDYGLDLLSVIVEEQLKPVQFAYFDAANAIALLRQYILNEIKHCNRGCSPEELDYYIKINFPNQDQFSKRFYPGGASDCGVSGRILPHRGAGCL